MVGDILEVKEGDKIFVDGLVIDSNEIEVDESSMTGETDLLKKDSFANCMQKVANNRYKNPPSLFISSFNKNSRNYSKIIKKRIYIYLAVIIK